MSTFTQLIEQIKTYILRCNYEKNYPGTQDEQMSLQIIKENYQNLSPGDQKDVQDHYHILYSQSVTPFQKDILAKAKVYAMQAAAVGAMGGAVGGVVLGAGVFKSAVASGICAFGFSFFANRELEKSNQDVAFAKNKIRTLDRINAIFGCSLLSSTINLSLPNLDEVRLRHRLQGSR